MRYLAVTVGQRGHSGVAALRKRRATSLPLLAVALAVAGCGNPVVDVRIEALGDEVDGVEPSEFHRPGQPCVLCHSEYEGADPPMAIGGTIFATPDLAIPVEGVKVSLTDAVGETMETTSNCIGNFFITSEQWAPAFPLRAEIQYIVPGTESLPDPTIKVVTMSSRISRDGSCAGCHDGVRTQASPGWVYCSATPVEPPFPDVASTCAGKAP